MAVNASFAVSHDPSARCATPHIYTRFIALDKIRRVLNLVYKHGQRHGLIPRGEEANPIRFVRCKTTSDYEAFILTPQQGFDVLLKLKEPERTLTLLASATGLRISECLGLQWQGVSFERSQVQVRRTWTCGSIGLPKSKASHAPVPLHPILAEFMKVWKNQTPYSQPSDWVFASFRRKGKQPRVANMLVEDHLRPAAVAAGVLAQGDTRRFGFHNLRHSLASFLVRTKTDIKTVQSLMRHSDDVVYAGSLEKGEQLLNAFRRASTPHQNSIKRKGFWRWCKRLCA